MMSSYGNLKRKKDKANRNFQSQLFKNVTKHWKYIITFRLKDFYYPKIFSRPPFYYNSLGPYKLNVLKVKTESNFLFKRGKIC